MKKPNGYWNYEMCKNTALKYKTKKQLKDQERSCYTKIISNKWYDLLEHMEPIGNLYKRCVYAYEFDNNYVYIGLTFNLEKRNKQHRTDSSSSVYLYIKETNLQPKLVKLTDYLSNKIASKLEIKTIEKYLENGWKILNRAKGGSLGLITKYWTKERCIEEGLKYESKKEFRLNSYSSYKISLRNNWLDEVTSHMIELKKPKGYWTKERCIEEGLKYESKSEMIKNSPNSYKISLRNNWLNEVTSHMIELKKPKGYWTKERCIEEGLKYESIKEFRQKSFNSYKIAYRKGYICEIELLIKNKVI